LFKQKLYPLPLASLLTYLTALRERAKKPKIQACPKLTKSRFLSTKNRGLLLSHVHYAYPPLEEYFSTPPLRSIFLSLSSVLEKRFRLPEAVAPFSFGYELVALTQIFLQFFFCLGVNDVILLFRHPVFDYVDVS